MTLTVDDLRSYLQIGSHTGNDDNAHLRRALDAAVATVADYTGRTFTAPGDTGSARYFQARTYPIYVDDFVEDPSQVQKSADRTTWTTVSTSLWWTGPDNLETRNVISGIVGGPYWKVTAKWGVGPSMLARVELPTLMKAAQIYKRRDSVNGVEGFGEFGVVRITRSADPHIAELLDPLRRMDRAGIA